MNVVGPHRLASLDIGLADAELVHDIAASEYQRRDTGEPALVVMAAQRSMRCGKDSLAHGQCTPAYLDCASGRNRSSNGLMSRCSPCGRQHTAGQGHAESRDVAQRVVSRHGRKAAPAAARGQDWPSCPEAPTAADDRGASAGFEEAGVHFPRTEDSRAAVRCLQCASTSGSRTCSKSSSTQTSRLSPPSHRAGRDFAGSAGWPRPWR